MNKNELIKRLDGLSVYGVLNPYKMHAFRCSAAVTSDVFHIGYRNGYYTTPCLLEMRKGYSFNRSDLLSVTDKPEYSDILFQLFRSYSTYCAVSIVTANSAYVLVTHAPTTATRTQLAKYTDDISKSNTGFRVNLYKDSRATIAQAFRDLFPDAIRFDIDATISAARSNSHALYAIPSNWDAYFNRPQPPIFTPDLTRAVDMIFRFAYGVSVDTVGLTLRG